MSLEMHRALAPKENGKNKNRIYADARTCIAYNIPGELNISFIEDLPLFVFWNIAEVLFLSLVSPP